MDSRAVKHLRHYSDAAREAAEYSPGRAQSKPSFSILLICAKIISAATKCSSVVLALEPLPFISIVPDKFVVGLPIIGQARAIKIYDI